jgi:hypothetical protein
VIAELVIELLVELLAQEFPKLAFFSRFQGSCLINSRQEFDTELSRIKRYPMLRANLVVVEYCDTSDEDGLFRKYSAFRVGDAIIPRHVFFSKQWIQKFPSNQIVNDEQVYEERQYLDANPHEHELMDLFEAANIQYGRIDYGLCNNQIQVWEINTNPLLISEKSMKCRFRGPHQELFLERILKVFCEIDSKAVAANKNISTIDIRQAIWSVYYYQILAFLNLKLTSVLRRYFRWIWNIK